jgi:hypothetical protein
MCSGICTILEILSVVACVHFTLPEKVAACWRHGMAHLQQMHASPMSNRHAYIRSPARLGPCSVSTHVGGVMRFPQLLVS